MTHPLEQVLFEVKRTIVGQDVLLERMAIGLLAGGHLLVETGEHQTAEAVRNFTAHGLTARVVECEELYATVVVGTRATGS